MDSTAYSNAPDLDDTSERQAALRRYHVLDTAPEEEFDRITSLVAQVCDVPTALITLIDDERQWFKSCFGFDRRETDVGISFCVHAVHENSTLVVEDATTDPRFKDNPIVTGPPHVRFYAGAPLTTPNGVDIGTLCILDYEPRTFDASQRAILTRLADTVVDQFERRSAEAQVRQLVEENPQPMYVYAADEGDILNANAAARDQYGYDESTFLSLTVDDLKAPPAVQPAVRTRLMHERADGSRFAVRIHEQEVLFNGRTARLAVPTLLSDETEDVAEIAFQASSDGTLQSLSADWERATGLPVSDVVGTKLTDLIVPGDRAAALEVLSPLADGTQESCRHETRLQTTEGDRPFAVRARVVRNADQRPIGVVGTLTPLGPVQSAPADRPVDPEAVGPDFTTPDRLEVSTEEDYSVFSTSLPFAQPPSDAPDESASDPSETEESASEPPESASANTAASESDASASEASVPEPGAEEESPPASGEAAPSVLEESSDAPSSESPAPEPSVPDRTAFETSESDSHSDASVFSASPSEGRPTEETASPSSEDDSMPAPSDAVDLTSQLHDLLDRRAANHDRPDITLQRSLPDTVVPVALPPDDIADLVDALLDNALAHTEDGSITLRLTTEAETAEIAIEDTGSGAEERFMQVYNPTSPSAKTLQRVHQQATQMGISLNMEDGEAGTRFLLTVPRASTSDTSSPGDTE